MPSKRLEAIKKILQEKNEPAFRFNQIRKAIFMEKIPNYDDIKNIPLGLRDSIKQQLGQSTLVMQPSSIQKSAQAIKILFRLHDNQSIESVYMKFLNGKTSLCISSQVGCALKCNFCATGAVGFKRQLTTDEIVDQILYFQQQQKQVDSVSFMGMYF
jgi:23S rRNA (adenine-C8)-methyltransferase